VTDKLAVKETSIKTGEGGAPVSAAKRLKIKTVFSQLSVHGLKKLATSYKHAKCEP